MELQESRIGMGRASKRTRNEDVGGGTRLRLRIARGGKERKRDVGREMFIHCS